MENPKHHATVRVRLLLTLLMTLFVSAMYAQTQKVTGVVLDDNGEPLVGATIRVVGKSNIATTTDANGEFSLTTPQNCFLSASYIGMKTNTARVKPGDNVRVRIVLDEDGKELDDVVVTALGISREAKSLGYARQSINTDGLDDTRDPNLLNSLTGKVSGVNFISNGGPMASTRVEIRGNNSLTGNNQPLYVVDGVPILNDMGESGDLDYGNPASFISPDDIASIEVLKGANASALYGSDAANGVILITTRQAKAKKGIGISYDFNAQWSYLREYPLYQNVYGTLASVYAGDNSGTNYFGNGSKNGYEYNPDLPYGIYVFNWANKNQRSWGFPMLGFDVVGRNNEIRPYSPTKESITDMYETGVQLTNNLSIDKVFNGGNIRLSYTGIDYDGMLKNFNDMKRHNFSLTSNLNLAKWLTTNVSINYQLEDADNRDYKGDSSRNPMRAIMNMPRDATLDELLPYKKDNGEPMARGNGFYNPYWLINEITNGDNRNYFRGNLTFTITPVKHVSVRLRGSLEKTNKKGWKFDNMYTMWDIDGRYEAFNEQSSNTNFEAVTMYNNRWKKFSLSALVGTSYLKQEWDKTTNVVNQLAAPDVKALSNNASILTGNQNHSGKEKQSVFGTASFGYDGLFLDGTFRNDWSSSLPKGNNSYFYYSGSFSAVLTDMIPKLKETPISFLKLRGSYARVGNDTGFDRLIDGYSYGGLFLNDMAWFTGDNVKKNNHLKPETTISKEVGLELRLFKDRLNLDVTYYDKSTRDQIVESAQPYPSGYQRVLINSGEISNKGWEISIKAIPLRFKDFQWRTIINWSKNNSMVESLPEGIDKIQIGSGYYNTRSYAEVGRPYGAMYAQVYKRNEKGQILCSSDGNPKQAADMEYIGGVQADWRGGWQNEFRYKNFGFSIMIDFQKGGHFLSQSAIVGATDGQSVQSLEGRWEYFLSSKIMGESAQERYGFLDPGNTLTNKSYTELYPDWQRAKGVYIPNCVYDDDVEGLAGQEVKGWASPEHYWMHYLSRDITRFIYDASYIKLREITISYDFPKKWIAKTPLQGVRLAGVGRNLATIFSHTPKGLDPQSTSTTGNAQGFERGFNLPEASLGFDIKVTF